MSAPNPLVELRDAIPASGRARPMWCCNFPNCVYESEFLTTAMFHVQDAHRLPMDRIRFDGSGTLVLNPQTI